MDESAIEGLHAVAHAALVEVGEEVAVGDEHAPVKRGCDVQAVDIDGAPHLADGIEAGLGLAVGVHAAIGAVASIAIEDAVLDVETALAEVLAC